MYQLAIAVIFSINLGQVYNYGTIYPYPFANPVQDAQYIQTAADRDTAIGQVFPFRTFYQRQLINNTYPLVPSTYVPLGPNTFQDLVFALVAGPTNTFVAYLHSCLEYFRPINCPNIIIEILITADTERQFLIDTYNRTPNYRSIQEAVKDNTDDDYKHFLTELLRRQREPDPQYPQTVNVTDVNVWTQNLILECAYWENNRKNLDTVMMNKSKAFARQVIAQFRDLNKGTDITQVIPLTISDKRLQFGYTSLVNFINNGYNYVVSRIHDSENEIDMHATKILFITAYSETYLYELNLVFIQTYGMPIGQFLLNNNSLDPTDQLLALVSGYGTINFNGW